jgi:hypothetical protein
MADAQFPRVYHGSRVKAGVLVLVCAGFVGLGWWLIGLGSVPTEAIGWSSMTICGVFGLLWLVGIFWPNHLTIERDGFTVKQWFLPEKRYRFQDIAALGVSRRQRFPMVVWTYKKRSEVLGEVKAALGQANDYDAYLPVGWQVSADVIAEQITLARQSYLSHASN